MCIGKLLTMIVYKIFIKNSVFGTLGLMANFSFRSAEPLPYPALVHYLTHNFKYISIMSLGNRQNIGFKIENILPQIVYFSLSTNLIKSNKTLLYLLNFQKLNTLEPIDVNYSVAILTNYYDNGQALRIVQQTGERSFRID